MSRRTAHLIMHYVLAAGVTALAEYVLVGFGTADWVPDLQTALAAALGAAMRGGLALLKHMPIPEYDMPKKEGV